MCRPICFLSHQSFSEKGVHSKRKECAPTESTVFPLRVDPFLEGRQNNFDNVISLESVSISLDIRSQIKGIWRVFRHSVDPGIYIDVKPSSVAQLDARPTGDQEVESSTPPGRQHSFAKTDHEICFYGHALPSADSRRAAVSSWRNNVHITG